VPPGVALMDPAYGNISKLRAGISGLALTYVAGIQPTTMVWRRGKAPLPPASRAGRGRPGTRLHRDETHRPVSAPRSGTCRRCLATDHVGDGSNTPLTSRFARWRVRPAHDDASRSETAAEEWLLIEWPEGEAEPDHYWFSTLPADISFESVVDQAKLPPASAGAWLADRARLSRTQAGNRSRTLRGAWLARPSPPCNSLHRSLRCTAAYGFLISEKTTIPLRTYPRPAMLAICRSRRLPTQRISRGGDAVGQPPQAGKSRHKKVTA
jgi:DDE superfamily endonuclease